MPHPFGTDSKIDSAAIAESILPRGAQKEIFILCRPIANLLLVFRYGRPAAAQVRIAEPICICIPVELRLVLSSFEKLEETLRVDLCSKFGKGSFFCNICDITAIFLLSCESTIYTPITSNLVCFCNKIDLIKLEIALRHLCTVFITVTTIAGSTRTYILVIILICSLYAVPISSSKETSCADHACTIINVAYRSSCTCLAEITVAVICISCNGTCGIILNCNAARKYRSIYKHEIILDLCSLSYSFIFDYATCKVAIYSLTVNKWT